MSRIFLFTSIIVGTCSHNSHKLHFPITSLIFLHSNLHLKCRFMVTAGYKKKGVDLIISIYLILLTICLFSDYIIQIII